MMTDPIADMLTRIRNAGRAKHRSAVFPASKLKLAVAKVMCDEGFVAGVSAKDDEGHPTMKIDIRYRDDGTQIIDGLRRVSSPGSRVYVGAEDVPKLRNGLGMLVLSTSRGVMCDRDARAAHLGGEIICEVW